MTTAMDEHWSEFLKTLPPSAAQTVRDSMERGESITRDAFRFAWKAAVERAVDACNECREVADTDREKDGCEECARAVRLELGADPV